MTRIAEIADRLRRLAKRREMEGIYTDAALCQEAADALAAIGAGGQAVAWQYRYNGATYVTNSESQARQGFDVTPLYAQPHPADERTCTCHPDDNPPKLCSEKYALSECRKAADERVVEALRRMLRLFDDQGNLIADFAQMQGAIGNGYQALSAKEGRS